MKEPSIEELKRELASINLVLKIEPTFIKKICDEILEIAGSKGLQIERRAEGYALTPSPEAAVVGLPHLRLALRGDVVTMWVRAPYSLSEELCEKVGLKPETIHQMLLKAAQEIASLFRRYGKNEDYVMISLPKSED